jgi:hypothetical protein
MPLEVFLWVASVLIPFGVGWAVVMLFIMRNIKKTSDELMTMHKDANGFGFGTIQLAEGLREARETQKDLIHYIKWFVKEMTGKDPPTAHRRRVEMLRQWIIDHPVKTLTLVVMLTGILTGATRWFLYADQSHAQTADNTQRKIPEIVEAIDETAKAIQKIVDAKEADLKAEKAKKEAELKAAKHILHLCRIGKITDRAECSRAEMEVTPLPTN